MSDSDSEADLLPNNVLSFQNQGTTISAKGPNINSTNISSLSFRNNIMTSTMNMPWNMDRPRYAESIADQRSMYYNRERETSPTLSLHSASGMQPRNLHNSFYPGAMSSHRSMYSGRNRSPTQSIRSYDSNTSMSAKDIAFAFQNGTFNKFDFQIIKDAYNRFMKHRTRRRVEKKRNVRQFLKGLRRKSGGDSGDQASNSSISSDDCRSIRTSRSTLYKENMSSCRSTKTDIMDVRRRMRDSSMFRDCSDNFRQNSFKNMFSGSHARQKEDWQNLQKWQNNSVVNSIMQPQKDRFRSGFQLPSQRFNQSIASLPIPERSHGLQRINEGNMLDIRHNVPNQIVRENRPNQETDSEKEEIFADVTVLEKTGDRNSGKRILEGADIVVPEQKRPKLSPPKTFSKPKTPKHTQTSTSMNKKSNDFVFAKPQLPIKKPSITKQPKPTKSTQAKEKPAKENEVANASQVVDPPVEKVISSSQKDKPVDKLISKSSQPLEAVKINRENNVQKAPENISQPKESIPNDSTLHSTTDMSMRPSFIKRKLFTQKVDLADKNSSSDSLQADSPQTNIYSKIQKEKNRARTLVTSQSCLIREVEDDSNLLELIHKVVPAERMNVTTAANKTEIQNKSKPANSEKFDVTTLITTCANADDVSDTFTDEEIFAGDDSQKQHKENVKDKTVEKPLGVKEQIIQKPQEKKKKSPNKVKNKTEGKEQSTNKSNKVIDQKNVVNKTNTKSSEQLNKKPIDSKKKAVTTKEDVINKNPVITHCKPVQQVKKTTESPKVVLEKSLHMPKLPANTVHEPVSPTERFGLIKAQIYKGVKSFWDTDTESDLESTPLKRIQPNIAVSVPPTTAKIAEHPVKKVAAPVNKDNETLINKPTKSTTQVKTVANQKTNSTILNTENKSPAKKLKTVNKSVEIKSTEDEHVKTKPKQTVKTVNNKKTIPASKKENKPPGDVSNTAKNKVNASLKVQNSGVTEKPNKISKARLTLKDYDSTLSNNESQNKSLNNTMRIRAQRKPKVKGCCCDDDKTHESHQTTTKNNESLCRSLRSREVDLSTSLKSDDGNVTVAKKTAAKTKRPAKNSKISKIIADNDISDLSFTLATDVPASDRTLRNKTVNSKEHKVRKSDVSFTLASENKSANDTISTRSSRRNREVESLQNNSASFFKSGKRSQQSKNFAAESRAINKSSNSRLNRSRRLL
ncbi:hypothetical protein NE865_05041 [Phthorimaea operculella]|nr:hypothetical protein NE865_05041 [Phthorimaea operculella]